MKSITGVEFNNPNVCIAGMSNFACVCKPCMDRSRISTELILKKLDEGKDFATALKETKEEINYTRL